ncbi:MAG TPA: hypothetical protein VKA46_00130 [Gemmataceae bacterium]|nr:hypothetical protein [Gemmataceae bacterium]
MSFSKPWRTLSGPDEREKRLPVLDVYLRTAGGSFVREVFVVDSGADVSMGPRRLCELVGLRWEDGELIQVTGIAQHEECVVPATIHMLDIYIRDAGCQLTIPFCFAEGDAPLLIGREGFFDAFRVTFDKPQFVTVFELVRSVAEGSP